MNKLDEYYEKPKYTHTNINFQLGSKRGGVGDSSHWSSGTEYLNEQYRRANTAFNFKYKMNNNVRRNNRKRYRADAQTEHTDYKVSDDSNREYDKLSAGFFPYHESSERSEIVKNLMSDNADPIDMFYDDSSNQGIAFEMFSYIDWGFDTDHDQLNSNANF